jgi:hypothetical protein
MKSKEDLKRDADKVALEFGYNPDIINSDIINVKDAYCNGYMNGVKDASIDFLIWKSKKGYYAQGATNHITNDTPLWIRQENQLCFSPAISSNQLFKLYKKETQ